MLYSVLCFLFVEGNTAGLHSLHQFHDPLMVCSLQLEDHLFKGYSVVYYLLYRCGEWCSGPHTAESLFVWHGTSESCVSVAVCWDLLEAAEYGS